MSTYATALDVEAYIEGWSGTDAFALERLIQRSERDLDRLVQPVNYQGLPPTQVISVQGATGGTFTLSFNGAASSSIPNNASASQVQQALQTLSAIGAGNVTVLGSNPWTVVWNRQWATAYKDFIIPLLVADGSLLVPGTSTAGVVLVEGLKIDPLVDLNANQGIALARATCAQVEYRNSMGEDFFVRAQYDSVQGPDFTTRGKLPFIAPKAVRELSQTGLFFRQGRAVASGRRYGVGKGWPTY